MTLALRNKKFAILAVALLAFSIDRAPVVLCGAIPAAPGFDLVSGKLVVVDRGLANDCCQNQYV
jgi:hypothetical protein